MLLEISHITEYSYRGEVFFEPHYLRFKPKATPHLAINDFSLQIEPKPSGLSEHIDSENNHNLLCWFDGMHNQLKIISNAKIEVNEFNPFNYLIHPPEYLNIPFEYDKRTKQLLEASLSVQGISESISVYIKEILKKSNNQSINALIQLTQEIHKDFKLKSRETGKPHHPDFTFKQKEGSCRDLAWMQIQMLRQLGVASRFVSGYNYVDAEKPEFELHAWVEVFMPGAGWIGLDPAHGIVTNEYHIPVASSAFYHNTMPVSGSIRGKHKSTLKNELKITHN